MKRKKLEDQTMGDIIVNVLLAALIPMAGLGVWFLCCVRWWV